MRGWEEAKKVERNNIEAGDEKFYFTSGFEIICPDSIKVLCTACHFRGWESQNHIISVAFLLYFMPVLLVFGSRLLMNI